MPPRVDPAGSEPELDNRLPRTDCPPVHYVVEINSVTELLNLDKYESGVFVAGGYKWSLTLRPKGKEYMSLHLSIEERDRLRDGQQVRVKYKFFVFDNNAREYVTFQEKGKKLRAFTRAQTQWGFSKFLSLARFNNPELGYRKNDYCKFGAEVLVSEPQRKKETLTIRREPHPSKTTTKIRQFSASNSNYQYSDVFPRASRNWKLRVSPQRDGRVKRLSVYLEAQSISPGKKIYVKANLRVLNTQPRNNKEKTVSGWLSDKNSNCGHPDFMPWGNLEQMNGGWFVHRNELAFEVEILVISHVNRRDEPV